MIRPSRWLARRRGLVGALVALSIAASACATPPERIAPEPEGPVIGPGAQLVVWEVENDEALDLWYHGLALMGAPQPGEEASFPLPSFRVGYGDMIEREKRSRGVYPTPLDTAVAGLRARIEEAGGAEAVQNLSFVPLFLPPPWTVTAAMTTWTRAEGDPSKAGSAAAGAVVNRLNTLITEEEVRAAAMEFSNLLETEAQLFYREYRVAHLQDLRTTVTAVRETWRALREQLRTFLDYVQLEGGDLLLSPALGPEGRSLTSNVSRPVVVTQLPEPGQHEAAVWGFLHELLYALVPDVIEDEVAPSEIQETGLQTLTTRAAVRAGEMLLEERSPVRLEAYRAHFVRAADPTVPAAEAGTAAALARTFPLPDRLVTGLRQAIELANSGI
ncbi:MAG TPA: hypothetical protein VK837_03030 [Longimicrobiales bacterium]|nr:hypothetical protein [Longimicrobiales bacterium]